MKRDAYFQEKTYEERLKDESRILLLAILIIEIILLYLSLNLCAISAYEGCNFIEALSKLTVIMQYPFYFIDILRIQGPYNLLGCFATMMIGLIAGMFIYSEEIKRIHHNVNTLKGSAEWNNAIEMSKKYAEWS